jgi:Fe-S cluster assembly protein SufD
MAALPSLRDTLLELAGPLLRAATTDDARGPAAQRYERLSTMEFPGRKTEAWKYTRTEALADPACWQPAAITRPKTLDLQGIVICPGITAEGELAPGVHWSRSSTPANADHQPFAGFHPFSLLADLATNARFRLHITPQADRDIPILLLIGRDTGGATHLGLDICAEPGCEATIIHSISGAPADAAVHNEHLRIEVGRNAHLTCLHWEVSGQALAIVSALSARLERDASLHFHQASLGTRLIRNDRHIDFRETGANATLNGFYLAGQQQHVDNHITLEHASGQTHSDTLYKGLLRGDGRGVFNGRIHIHPGAQKTAAHLNNRNLMLSREAEVDTKPELEIYADDVQCSHGASIGQIDRNALFYFESRGIDRITAEAMLSAGFIHEVIDSLPHEPAADVLRQFCADFLAGASTGAGSGTTMSDGGSAP